MTTVKWILVKCLISFSLNYIDSKCWVLWVLQVKIVQSYARFLRELGVIWSWYRIDQLQSARPKFNSAADSSDGFFSHSYVACSSRPFLCSYRSLQKRIHFRKAEESNRNTDQRVLLVRFLSRPEKERVPHELGYKKQQIRTLTPSNLQQVAYSSRA